MKSVLISIRPKWVEKIASGKKTIEVRKTAPKETPFKAYIYCSYGNDKENYMLGKRGKVIGEFICDKIMFLTPLGLRGFETREETLKSICLTNAELNAYGGLKTLYGWHISNLKIYEEPKELNEFTRPCSYVGLCFSCKRAEFINNGDMVCKSGITRPPQSYMFVEEVRNDN